jgi:hypothetical protein
LKKNLVMCLKGLDASRKVTLTMSLVQLTVSSVRESVEGGLEPGSRRIAIVGAVTRKRLVWFSRVSSECTETCLISHLNC